MAVAEIQGKEEQAGADAVGVNLSEDRPPNSSHGFLASAQAALQLLSKVTSLQATSDSPETAEPHNLWISPAPRTVVGPAMRASPRSQEFG